MVVVVDTDVPVDLVAGHVGLLVLYHLVEGKTPVDFGGEGLVLDTAFKRRHNPGQTLKKLFFVFL